MSKYTPTAGALLEIYRGYRRRNRGLIGSAPPHRQIEAEFDRWLDQVKAEARREGQAQAWAEGHSWGWSDAQDAHDVRQEMARADWPLCTPNPYEDTP